MATATATAAKLNVALRRSTLQESAVVLQERAWVQEAMGELRKRGQSLMDRVSRSTYNYQAPAAAAAAAMVAISNVAHPGLKHGIVPDDPLESLVANLQMVARRGHHYLGNVGLSLQSAQAADLEEVPSSQRLSKQAVAGRISKAGSQAAEVSDEDYGWETDPNGGWLASFP